MAYLFDKIAGFFAALFAFLPFVSSRNSDTSSDSTGPARTIAKFQRLSDVNREDTASRAHHHFEGSIIHAPELPIDAPVYAIGDVHGRADLLNALIDVIVDDCKASGERPHLVFLGDYIDRGFQSRDVISTLIELGRDDTFETVFLKGNHEQAMLRFLHDHKIGPDWANFGGRETLISYGISPPKSVNAVDEWQEIQQELVKTIPPQHVEFLEKLAVSHKIGPYGFVHAGVKPGVPYEQQTDEDRMWIRDEFLNAKDKEDLFIVHGHTPVNAPYSDHRRVNVDTGAYFTGRLTAVKIEGDKMSFLTNQFQAQEAS
ncbi:MAG: serine/threonine protein phosphatase [Hyphomonadaceae bacterium]|nr:serine/threonine protein phosphatase [Hyphomonadaceae bacterium]